MVNADAFSKMRAKPEKKFLCQLLTGCCPNRFYASTSSARMEMSYDFNTPPFALSLSKGKRLVWATARSLLTFGERAQIFILYYFELF
jgi:hypothetical protein